MLALDTAVLSALQKLKPQAFSHYQRAVLTDKVVIPPVVRYEARRSLLNPRFSRRSARLDVLLSGHDVLDVDSGTADVAASIDHQLRAAGSLIEDADLLIAATCLQQGATLVTRNTDHFQRISGLRVVDWL